MKTVNISDQLYNQLRRLAYDNDTHIDDYAEDILHKMLPVEAAPKRTKAQMMAALRAGRKVEKYGADWQTNLCAHCGGELPTYHLPNTTYCTDRCKQAAYRDRKRQAV